MLPAVVSGSDVRTTRFLFLVVLFVEEKWNWNAIEVIWFRQTKENKTAAVAVDLIAMALNWYSFITNKVIYSTPI